MFKVVQEGWQAKEIGSSLLDDLPRRCPADAGRGVVAEVAAHVEAHRGEVDADGHRLVVCNGFHAAREVTTAAGAVQVRQPRVNDSEPMR